MNPERAVLPSTQWWQDFMRGQEAMPRPLSEAFQKRCRALIERLAFTVPLQIRDLAAQGGIGDYHLNLLGHFSAALAEKGDVLQFDHTPEREDLVRMLSEGLAIMAFLPGGVTFCGHHFEVTPKP